MLEKKVSLQQMLSSCKRFNTKVVTLFLFVMFLCRRAVSFGIRRNGCSIRYCTALANTSRRSYERVISEAFDRATRDFSSSNDPEENIDDGDLVILQSGLYTAHVVTKNECLTLDEVISKTILQTLSSSDDSKSKNQFKYSARDLLVLGSIWYLPPDSPRDPSLGIKPARVNIVEGEKGVYFPLDQKVKSGAYFRVHHNPRRFPAFHRYDWGASFSDSRFFSPPNNNTSNKKLPGVVVDEDEDLGYRIIMKPEGIPIHATVDNVVENVSVGVQNDILRRMGSTREKLLEKRKVEEALLGGRNRKQKMEPLIYVSTPQRLDHDTSGLVAVAISLEFSSYFAKLLRKKTDMQMKTMDKSCQQNEKEHDYVKKKYRCLICIAPTKGPSFYDEKVRLENLKNETIVHYLEPSIRAPKNFSATQSNSSWAQCLMTITDVGNIFPIRGGIAAEKLGLDLWGSFDAIPPTCMAVAEVEVNLLTGRTHQIRGQLSSSGFPLVGDVLYGGGVTINSGIADSYMKCERLSLQCCELTFAKPMLTKTKRDKLVFQPTNDLLTWRIERAWWTSKFEKYVSNAKTDESKTISCQDDNEVIKLKNKSNVAVDSLIITSRDLPPRISIEEGTHKYIIIEAREKASYNISYYVKSASPKSCGGPYHADVARNLVDKLNQCGYQATVIGGGRIEFDKAVPHAHVYGFSYGFGKANHALVAELIENFSDIIATYNEDDGNY